MQTKKPVRPAVKLIDGHAITTSTAVAMRQGLRQTCEALDNVSEAARKGQFGGIHV